MTITNLPAFTQNTNLGLVTIVLADAQAYKTGFTAGANGSLITSILVSSTDTSNRDITVNITRSATNYQISQVSIPLTAGTINNVPPVSLLNNISQLPGVEQDGFGNRIWKLKSGDTLTFNAPVTITTGKTITIAVFGEDL